MGADVFRRIDLVRNYRTAQYCSVRPGRGRYPAVVTHEVERFCKLGPVVGFSFLIMIPIIILFYSESAHLEDEIIAAQAQRVMNELIDAIDTVYYLGAPSKQTIKLYFPKKIEQVTVHDDAITFRIDSSLGGSYDLTGYAGTNMTGTIDKYSGIHLITVIAGNSSVTIVDR